MKSEPDWLQAVERLALQLRSLGLAHDGCERRGCAVCRKVLATAEAMVRYVAAYRELIRPRPAAGPVAETVADGGGA